MRNLILMQSLILFLFPVLAGAAIYKWTDADGKVHYSQQKPASTESKRMHVDMHPPTDTSSYKKPSLKKDKGDKKPADQAKGNDQKKPPELTAEQRKQRCERAQKVMQTLTSRGRVRERDKDGNIRYMTDEEKNNSIKQQQKNIEKYCH